VSEQRRRWPHDRTVEIPAVYIKKLLTLPAPKVATALAHFPVPSVGSRSPDYEFVAQPSLRYIQT
jgi:hypothetical protein